MSWKCHQSKKKKLQNLFSLLLINVQIKNVCRNIYKQKCLQERKTHSTLHRNLKILAADALNVKSCEIPAETPILIGILI